MSEKSHILVVDDDQDTRTVVKTILSSSGYEVSEAAGGQECLDSMESRIPDLIVLDIMMPEMSGYDVVIRLKQQPKTQDIPVIMLTAKSDPEDLLMAYREYGIEYYIPKPFTTKQLTSGIALVLGSGEESSDSEKTSSDDPSKAES